MTPKKQPVRKEPFLNTVARKLGHAAGALTNVAQGLTDNLSALPKAASQIVSPSKTSKAPTKRPRRAAPRRGKNRVTGGTKRKTTPSRSPRRSKSINRRKKK